jgi:hypothetical protein
VDRVGDNPSNKLVGAPESIGVVLVTKRSREPDESMTYWYTLGNYISYGTDFSKLMWKDGILVTSLRHEVVGYGASSMIVRDIASRLIFS